MKNLLDVTRRFFETQKEQKKQKCFHKSFLFGSAINVMLK